MIKIRITMAFVLFSYFLYAQEFNTFLRSDITWDVADSNSLILEVDNVNFFKNNELMADFKQGYTLPGYLIQPRLTYYPGDKTRISAGVHFVQMFGDVDYYEVRPTFSIQHALTPKLHMVMGELHGNLNHGLIDPLYNYDKYFIDNLEQGLQLLVISDFFKADLWLDWENFILWDDPSQEEGTLGFSGKVHLEKNNSQWTIDLPLQAIICHRGGQINKTLMPNNSQTNLAPGLQIFYFPGRFIESLSLKGHYVYFRDLDEVDYFREGYGIYPSFTIQTKLFEFQTSYWHAYKYYGPRGDPLYFSVSSYRNTIEYNRDMLINKIGFSKKYDNGISAGLFADTYYDVNNGTLEYNYSIYLRFNSAFFLKKVRQMERRSE